MTVIEEIRSTALKSLQAGWMRQTAIGKWLAGQYALAVGFELACRDLARISGDAKLFEEHYLKLGEEVLRGHLAELDSPVTETPAEDETEVHVAYPELRQGI